MDLLAKHNVNVYLYGSAARGEDVESSDIDLLLIGKLDKSTIVKELNKISKKIKKEIKFQIFSRQEWSLMARNDPAFYERVEKDKVKLV